MSRRIRHQSAHTGKLLDLLIGTAGSGVCHHEDVVVFIQTGQQRFRQRIVGLLPGLNDLFISLFLSDKTTLEVLGDPVHSILRFLDHLRLLRRHGHIGNRYGHCRSCGILISCGLDIIQHLCGLRSAVGVDDFLKDLL